MTLQLSKHLRTILASITKIRQFLLKLIYVQKSNLHVNIVLFTIQNSFGPLVHQMVSAHLSVNPSILRLSKNPGDDQITFKH